MQKAGRSFKNLDAWNVAMDLAVASYRVADRLPRTERYELSSQIRRAAVSVPSNIAEGHSSGTDGILVRHLRISLGSVGELETQMELAPRLGLLTAADVHDILEQITRTGKLLNGLIRSLRMERSKSMRAVALRPSPSAPSPSAPRPSSSAGTEEECVRPRVDSRNCVAKCEID